MDGKNITSDQTAKISTELPVTSKKPTVTLRRISQEEMEQLQGEKQ